MALEVSAAIIGILAAAGKVGETLGPLVSAYANAPKHAQTILTEVNHTRIALLGLQSLFEKFGTIAQRRKELVPIDQLIVALTDGVLLFSELEASVDRLKAPDSGFSNRFRWARKGQELDGCLTRLLGFKTSLALMLGILQCESDLAAEHDRTELISNIDTLLANDLALSQRLANLDQVLQLNELVVKHRPPSLAPTELFVQDEPWLLAKEQSDTAQVLPFESMLKRSRVYRGVRRSSEQFSFRSSTARSHAWSALSGMSLSDISHISVLALPLVASDIINADHYAFTRVQDGSGASRKSELSESNSYLPVDVPSPRPQPHSQLESHTPDSLEDFGTGVASDLELLVHGAKEANIDNFIAAVYARSPNGLDGQNPVGKSFLHNVTVDNMPVCLQVSVVGDYFLSNPENYNSSLGAFMHILVYDTSSLASFNLIRKLTEFPGFPFMVTGQTVMIVGKRNVDGRWREVTFEKGAGLAELNRCLFIEVYDPDYQMIHKLFSRLVKAKRENVKLVERRHEEDAASARNASKLTEKQSEEDAALRISQSQLRSNERVALTESKLQAGKLMEDERKEDAALQISQPQLQPRELVALALAEINSQASKLGEQKHDENATPRISQPQLQSGTSGALAESKIQAAYNLNLVILGATEAGVPRFIALHAQSSNELNEPNPTTRFVKTLTVRNMPVRMEVTVRSECLYSKDDPFRSDDMHMLIYSTSSLDSFQQIGRFLKIIEFRSKLAGLPAANIMVVGKRDAGSRVREVTFEQGVEFTRIHKCIFSEVYEADGQAVNALFRQLVKTKWAWDRNLNVPARAQALRAEQRKTTAINKLLGFLKEDQLESIQEDS